jgi:hypothetical protein
MVNLNRDDRGALLILVAMIIMVIAIMTSAFLSRLVTEKKSFTDELSTFQGLSLTESAANMAYAEMNKRFPGDLSARLFLVNSSDIRPYVDGNNSLGFLAAYAGALNATQFNITNSTAVLSLQVADYLNKGGDWNSSAKITVSPVKCSKASDDGPFYFNYTYKIVATTKMWQGLGADKTKGTSDDKYVNKTVSYAPSYFNVTASHSNFAQFALFTDNHKTPSGTTVWFTADTNFHGPVHTNDMFSFANNPSAHFYDIVTQSSANARFYNNGSSKTANADRYPVGCTDNCRDKPTFDNLFLRSEPQIILPTTVDQATLKTKATAGLNPANGIWLPNASGSLTAGIYIKGDTASTSDNSSITMSVDINNRPVYTIKQGANTKTVTVDYANNQTIVANVAGSGGTPAGTYTGIPNGTDHQGVVIYTNDDVGYWDSAHPSNNIAGLSGTVQKDTKITISSEKDLMITGNVLYEKDPTIAGNGGYQNILGILSWNGNVRVGTAAPDDILIDAVVMAPNPTAASGKGIFCVDNYDHGDARGTANLLGGVITDYYGAFGTFSGGGMQTGYGRNFIYDVRVLAGLTPPYFPYTSTFTSTLYPPDVFKTRTSWREQEN